MRKGFVNAQNQPIAMDFITGQQKAIEDRAGALAEPLERKLARLQAARQASLDASSFALERADKTAETERENQKFGLNYVFNKEQAAEEKRQFESGVKERQLDRSEANAQAQRDFDFSREQFEENKRQFGIEYAEGKRRTDLDYSLSEKKFNEDVRQFGLNYALAAREMAMKEAEAEGIGEPSQYSTERAQRTINSVDELMAKVGGTTVGWGSMLSGVPTSGARNFAAELDTLKSSIAFNELTAMREASKTGGALGQVSDREIKLLSSALGALDQGQSVENFKAQLEKIKGSIQRWQEAQGQAGGSGSWTDPDTGVIYNFSQGGGGTPKATAMRTDRSKNPTAFTTNIAQQAGLREGVDYVAGDTFPNNKNIRTAKLLGDPVEITRRVIDRIGFYTGSGAQRWTHTAMPMSQWKNMTIKQKNDTIFAMYNKEGNAGALNKYFS